jgi:hypothetical protein
MPFIFWPGVFRKPLGPGVGAARPGVPCCCAQKTGPDNVRTIAAATTKDTRALFQFINSPGDLTKIEIKFIGTSGMFKKVTFL